MATGYSIGLDQAQKYLNDPFTEAQPADETGLNSHFRSTFDPVQPGGAVDPAAVPVAGTTSPRRPSSSPKSGSAAHSRNASRELRTRSRGSSLSQRFPGDKSHQPLDMLKHDAKKAHRSHHLRKSSIPGVDTVDALDDTPGGRYHHEGPYDATLASRNRDSRHSPIAATFDTTAQTLKATPLENIRNSLDKHMPLDGVAQVAPGYQDRNRRTYAYEDTNGPSGIGEDFTKVIDEDRNHKKPSDRQQEKSISYDGVEATAIELTEQPQKQSDHAAKKQVEVSEHEVGGAEIGDESSGHHKHHTVDGLKRRIGSLRKKHD